MVDLILQGTIFGMAGFLVSAVLTRDGEILDWWPRVVRGLIRAKSNDFYLYNSTQVFFHKLLVGCSKCVAGQLAFWFMVFSGDYGHIAPVVIVAVFSAFSIEKYYER